jgi:Concanavalin A-like lectin/glucanases superfamily
MKKLLLSLCLYFIALGAPLAQVCTGDITLNKQSQVANFNCTEVTGKLEINSAIALNDKDPIKDLTPLLKLTKVGKDFIITNIDADLKGLASLKTVGGELRILSVSSPNITLNALESVGALNFTGGNTATKSVNLPSLKTVDLNLTISAWNALTDVNIPSLSTVKGLFSILGNNLLSKLNFSPNSLGGLNISNNPSLSDCSMFKNLLNTPGAIRYPTLTISNNKTNCNSKDEILKSSSPSTANNALAFDGVDDVIELGIPSFYKNSFTIEGWIKPQTGAIFNIYQDENSGVYAEVTQYNTVRFLVRNPPANAGGVDVFSKTNIVTDGQWHHFAAVKGDDDYLYLYIDGKPDGKSLYKIGDFSSTPFNMRLGMNVPNSRRYYKGLMDEIRFWNIARLPQDILANKDKTSIGNETGLTNYYKFNQGAANGDNKTMTTLNDSKGAMNGTLQKFLLNGSASNFTTGAPVQ